MGYYYFYIKLVNLTNTNKQRKYFDLSKRDETSLELLWFYIMTGYYYYFESYWSPLI
jgi:hypothetical protein